MSQNNGFANVCDPTKGSVEPHKSVKAVGSIPAQRTPAGSEITHQRCGWVPCTAENNVHGAGITHAREPEFTEEEFQAIQAN